jgi:nucleoside-diphosphate-sugar epimerase
MSLRVHLVIGASSFVGRHAVAALSEHVRVRSAELGDDLEAAMSGIEVVHMAAPLYSPYERLNAGVGHRQQPHQRLRELIRLARQEGVKRLVYVSSTAVFGPRRDVRLSERIVPAPQHPYERLLARDEEWLRQQFWPEVVVLRPAQLLGPGEPVLSSLVEQMIRGRPLIMPGGGHAPRSFLAGRDLGGAMAAAAFRGLPGAAYLLGGVRATWNEVVRAAAAALSVRARLGRLPNDLAYLVASSRGIGLRMGEQCWPTPYLVDLFGRPQLVEDGWSRRELGWEMETKTLEAGLAGLAEWVREGASAPATTGAVTSSPGTV